MVLGTRSASDSGEAFVSHTLIVLSREHVTISLETLWDQSIP